MRVKPTQRYGTPPLEHLRKTRGALLSSASAYSTREAAYETELPADQAAISRTALMTEGRPLTPAFLTADRQARERGHFGQRQGLAGKQETSAAQWDALAMTKGLVLAVESPVRSEGSSAETSMPMTSMPSV